VGRRTFEALQAGGILVAPLRAPAWTPLFSRAAAVVTDAANAAAHAPIIAREYGIPASAVATRPRGSRRDARQGRRNTGSVELA
jgi:phosphoenolpyruvate synthase/pyruvate phosphate dikinase